MSYNVVYASQSSTFHCWPAFTLSHGACKWMLCDRKKERERESKLPAGSLALSARLDSCRSAKAMKKKHTKKKTGHRQQPACSVSNTNKKWFPKPFISSFGQKNLTVSISNLLLIFGGSCCRQADCNLDSYGLPSYPDVFTFTAWINTVNTLWCFVLKACFSPLPGCWARWKKRGRGETVKRHRKWSVTLWQFSCLVTSAGCEKKKKRKVWAWLALPVHRQGCRSLSLSKSFPLWT